MMNINNIEIGTRVKYFSVGEGRVVHVNKGRSLSVAVVFDKPVGGHTLGNYGAPLCEDGHGLWCYKSDLEIIDEVFNYEINEEEFFQIING